METRAIGNIRAFIDVLDGKTQQSIFSSSHTPSHRDKDSDDETHEIGSGDEDEIVVNQSVDTHNDGPNNNSIENEKNSLVITSPPNVNEKDKTLPRNTTPKSNEKDKTSPTNISLKSNEKNKTSQVVISPKTANQNKSPFAREKLTTQNKSPINNSPTGNDKITINVTIPSPTPTTSTQTTTTTTTTTSTPSTKTKKKENAPLIPTTYGMQNSTQARYLRKSMNVPERSTDDIEMGSPSKLRRPVRQAAKKSSLNVKEKNANKKVLQKSITDAEIEDILSQGDDSNDDVDDVIPSSQSDKRSPRAQRSVTFSHI